MASSATRLGGVRGFRSKAGSGGEHEAGGVGGPSSCSLAVATVTVDAVSASSDCKTRGRRAKCPEFSGHASMKRRLIGGLGLLFDEIESRYYP